MAFWLLWVTKLAFHWFWSELVLLLFSIQTSLSHSCHISLLLICHYSHTSLLHFWNSKFASMTKRWRSLWPHPRSRRSRLKPVDRQLQIDSHNPSAENTKAGVTQLVKLCSEDRCNENAHLNVIWTVDEIPLPAVSRRKETFQSDIEVESKSQQCHPIIVHECRQHSIPGCPLESIANVHIWCPISNADNNCNEEEDLYRELDHPMAETKEASAIKVDARWDHNNGQIMNVDILAEWSI